MVRCCIWVLSFWKHNWADILHLPSFVTYINIFGPIRWCIALYYIVLFAFKEFVIPFPWCHGWMTLVQNGLSIHIKKKLSLCPFCFHSITPISNFSFRHFKIIRGQNNLIIKRSRERAGKMNTDLSWCKTVLWAEYLFCSILIAVYASVTQSSYGEKLIWGIGSNRCSKVYSFTPWYVPSDYGKGPILALMFRGKAAES